MQPGDVPTTYADASALEHDFGFTPKITLREGLRKFAEWYAAYYGTKRYNTFHPSQWVRRRLEDETFKHSSSRRAEGEQKIEAKASEAAGRDNRRKKQNRNTLVT